MNARPRGWLRVSAGCAHSCHLVNCIASPTGRSGSDAQRQIDFPAADAMRDSGGANDCRHLDGSKRRAQSGECAPRGSLVTAEQAAPVPMLRRMRCSGGCGGRVVAAWLVTGPVMNMRVRPRRVPLLARISHTG